MNIEIKDVHISTIKSGDTIVHNGAMTTVCKNNLSRGFLGIAVFGDSYRAGTIPVKKVLFIKPQ